MSGEGGPQQEREETMKELMLVIFVVALVVLAAALGFNECEEHAAKTDSPASFLGETNREDKQSEEDADEVCDMVRKCFPEKVSCSNVEEDEKWITCVETTTSCAALAECVWDSEE
jgi:antirestriction protein ArdC